MSLWLFSSLINNGPNAIFFCLRHPGKFSIWYRKINDDKIFFRLAAFGINKFLRIGRNGVIGHS